MSKMNDQAVDQLNDAAGIGMQAGIMMAKISQYLDKYAGLMNNETQGGDEPGPAPAVNNLRRRREESERKYWEAINNPDWKNNDKMFILVKSALETLEFQHGWYFSDDDVWKGAIIKVISSLELKGYKVKGREFYLDIHYPSTDGWVNTIKTDGSIDVRLVLDLIEVLEPSGFLVLGSLETMTFSELATKMVPIITSLRHSNLGLVREDNSNSLGQNPVESSLDTSFPIQR